MKTALKIIATTGCAVFLLLYPQHSIAIPPPLWFSTGYIDFFHGSESSFRMGNHADSPGCWDTLIQYLDQNTGWLSIYPENVCLDSQEEATITARAARDGLAPGLSRAVIKIISRESGDDEGVVFVSIETTGDDRHFSISRKLVFMDPSVPRTHVAITNRGPDILLWSIAEIRYGSGADGWLTVTPATARVYEGDSVAVAITVTRDGLRPGLYYAVIPVLSNGDEEQIRVLMRVGVF